MEMFREIYDLKKNLAIFGYPLVLSENSGIAPSKKYVIVNQMHGI